MSFPHDANPGSASTVDVAIVAYRGWELTESCLEHLRLQTLPHRITVCDNGCDQETSRLLSERYPEVRVIRMERNMPYPVACNAAVGAGEHEVVVMMNNDVDPHPDFLERLLAPFRSHPKLGSVAPLLVRPGEQEIDSAGLLCDRTLSAFPRYQGHPPGDARADGLVLAGPAGAAAAFRRAAWEEVGGLDESIRAYMEDFDLALRLRVAGWDTTVALDAIAVHVGSATFGHRSPEQRAKAGYSRGYLLRRYGVLRSRHAPRALVTEAVVIAGDLYYSRDTSALSGRISGWRSAAGRSRLPLPPPEAIDGSIGLLESLRLRRGAYRPSAPAKPAPAVGETV